MYLKNIIANCNFKDFNKNEYKSDRNKQNYRPIRCLLILFIYLFISSHHIEEMMIQ